MATRGNRDSRSLIERLLGGAHEVATAPAGTLFGAVGRAASAAGVPDHGLRNSPEGVDALLELANQRVADARPTENVRGWRDGVTTPYQQLPNFQGPPQGAYQPIPNAVPGQQPIHPLANAAAGVAAPAGAIHDVRRSALLEIIQRLRSHQVQPSINQAHTNIAQQRNL